MPRRLRNRGRAAAVRELVKADRARGEDLTGPDGLLKTITATVLEAGFGTGTENAPMMVTRLLFLRGTDPSNMR